MTTLNAKSVGKTRRSARTSAWVVLLVASGCSFKSLEHLQQGETKDAEATGGGAAGRQASTPGAASGGFEAGGSWTAVGASTSTSPVTYGGTLSQGTAGTDSVLSSSGGAFSGTGGTDLPSSAVGGAWGIGGTAIAESSVVAPSAGAVGAGGSGSGGESPTGGTTSAAGVSGSSSTSGGTGATENGGNGGSSGSTGLPTMSYGVPGQSCSLGLVCRDGTSCCSQIEIPGETFTMGTKTDPDRVADESPPHDATIDTFLMDRFEVTVGRFRRFAQAYDGTMPPTNAGTHPKIASSGWRVEFNASMPTSNGGLMGKVNCDVGNYQTWTETAGARETMPMSCVSWLVAFAFCVWDGGRLPTEAEWEMAAANGSRSRRFPWGDNAPASDKHAVMNCMGDGTSGCSPNDILPVGSRIDGANQWGHLDLAGSLWEWTLDFYQSTYYQAVGTCNNCSNLVDLTPRVIRGGSFTSLQNVLRATARASKPPNTFDPYTGFRCVRTP